MPDHLPDQPMSGEEVLRILQENGLPPMSAEAALHLLRNRENGLPPAIQDFLDQSASDNEDRALMLAGMEDLLLKQARKEFMKRYGEPDDEDLELKTPAEMEQDTARIQTETEEILHKRKQQSHN